MPRLIVAVALSLALGLSYGFAEDFFGTIKKIDGSKLTIERKKKGEEAKEVTIDAASAKVSKGKFNKEAKKVESGEALAGGLKNDAVKVGARVSVTAEGDKATEIRVFEGKKKE